MVSTTDETLELIERERLHDSGCGAVEVTLIASVLLTADAVLWTEDKDLAAVAKTMGVAYDHAL